MPARRSLSFSVQMGHHRDSSRDIRLKLRGSSFLPRSDPRCLSWTTALTSTARGRTSVWATWSPQAVLKLRRPRRHEPHLLHRLAMRRQAGRRSGEGRHPWSRLHRQTDGRLRGRPAPERKASHSTIAPNLEGSTGFDQSGGIVRFRATRLFDRCEPRKSTSCSGGDGGVGAFGIRCSNSLFGVGRYWLEALGLGLRSALGSRRSCLRRPPFLCRCRLRGGSLQLPFSLWRSTVRRVGLSEYDGTGRRCSHSGCLLGSNFGTVRPLVRFCRRRAYRNDIALRCLRARFRGLLPGFGAEFLQRPAVCQFFTQPARAWTTSRPDLTVPIGKSRCRSLATALRGGL